MSQGEELLNSLSENDISAYTADPSTEEHIVIGADRVITVPASLQRLAVQHDHNVETVIFDCPRYWDGHDMSEWDVFINYIRADSALGSYQAENVTVDESDETMMHFDWTIDGYLSDVAGTISFLVCIVDKDADGKELHHWNSELYVRARISKGLNCNTVIVERYPGVLEQILTRLNILEGGTTDNGETIGQILDRLVAAEEAAQSAKDWALAASEQAATNAADISLLQEEVSAGTGSGTDETLRAEFEALKYGGGVGYDTGEVEVTDITLIDSVIFGDLNQSSAEMTNFTKMHGYLDNNPTTAGVANATLDNGTNTSVIEVPVGYATANGPGTEYYYIGDDPFAIEAGTATVQYGFSVVKLETYEVTHSSDNQVHNVMAGVTEPSMMLAKFDIDDMTNISTYSLKVTQYYEENVGIHKIDPKFLPSSVSGGASYMKISNIDFSGWSSGNFVETLEDGTFITHTVTFDDLGNVSAIDDISINGVM